MAKPPFSQATRLQYQPRAETLDVSRRVWLDQGGVIAIAICAAEASFGESWQKRIAHQQAACFDDFVCLRRQFLIRSNYTNPSKLAIQGRQAMAACSWAHYCTASDLIGAVVSHFGI